MKWRKLLQWGYAPIARIRLIVNFICKSDRYVKAESYYAGRPRKTRRKIFFEQARHILRYGEINEFYFLYGFDTRQGPDASRYLDYRSFMTRRNALNLAGEHNYICLLRDKYLFGMIASAAGFPTVSTLGTYRDGKIVAGGSEYTLDGFLDLHPKLFFKPQDAECGEGIFSIDRNGDTYRLNDTEINSRELLESLAARKSGSYLIQPRLVQHSEMSRLYAHSVNTLRIITVRNRGGEFHTSHPCCA